MNKNKLVFRPSRRAIALEPRLLFDGAGAIAAADAAETETAQPPVPAATQQDSSSTPASTTEVLDNATGAGNPAPDLPANSGTADEDRQARLAGDDNPDDDTDPATIDNGDAANTLVVVDARVAEMDGFTLDLPANVTVRVVARDESGLDAVGQVLTESGQRYDTIHIISHGTPGSLTLGNETIAGGSLSDAQREKLLAWAPSLTDEADILLYGCDIAAGNEGEAFITELAHLTGADIAASTDATGAADKGGDWNLERTTGAIETPALNLAGFDGLLAATAVIDTGTAETRKTTEDTPLVISGVTVSGNASDVITLAITTTGGTSTLDGLAGLTVNGNGSTSISVTGTIANINTALATLNFRPEENRNSLTSGYTPKITLSVTAGGTGTLDIDNIVVTPVNDDPVLDGSPLVVREGGSAAFSLENLASSAADLDPDIGTGQQVLTQLMLTLDSLPTDGELTYKGGPVEVGTIIPVEDLDQLVYRHTAGDVAEVTTVTFKVTVHDGGGGSTSGDLSIRIEPVNQAPSVSGSPWMYEGAVASVAPTVDLGDANDSATVTIDEIDTGGQGFFFIDANNDGVLDAGEAIVGTWTGTLDDLAKLKFDHNGVEPDAAGVSTPSYRVTVSDTGGGEGPEASKSSTKTISIAVRPNNDDPLLDTNRHGSETDALVIDEWSTVTLDSTMLQIQDVDTPEASNLVYTLTSTPVQGQLQIQIEGTWYGLSSGARFTQHDIDTGRVRFMAFGVSSDQNVSFGFTVRDSAFGYDLSDRDGMPPGVLREGGVYDSNGTLKEHHFHITIRQVDDGSGNGQLPLDLLGATASQVASSSGAGNWLEGSDNTITDTQLSWTYVRENGEGTIEPTPAKEIIYTLTSLPTNGTVLLNGQALVVGENFSQDDINAGRVRFVHDGGEDFVSSFDYYVSDGNSPQIGRFDIDVTPLNDRPTANGGATHVREGGSVHLDASIIGLSDADGAEEAEKRTGEGAADFLWFKVSDLPAHGTLQRWNGSSWVAVDTNEWLPSTILTASVGGQPSGLRFVHDGTEPLAYAGGPTTSFGFVVRDDMTAPDSPFAADTSTPASDNVSETATVTIGIIPINDAPQVADRPSDTDPTIDGTINDGGALTGRNEVLANVAEGSTVTITSDHLTAVDRDNTTVQRQYRIIEAPALGSLLLDGKAIGVGSTFTQADIDAGKLSYRHNGSEVGALTTDDWGSYHDMFRFSVNDGVHADRGDTNNGNAFLITLLPTNDAPVVTAPGGPIHIDSTDPQYNQVPGFSVADPDLTDGIAAPHESDFIQVTVRLLDQSGNPITNYATGFGGGGVQIGHGAPTTPGLVVTQDGNNKILQFQGTREQVNQALAGLTVTFENDLNQRFRVEVIADDRLRDASGNLVTTGSDANGGEMNQATTPGGAPTAVDGTQPDWANGDAVPSGSHVLAGNISAASVEIWASHTNEAATFTGPTSVTVNEDVRTPVSGFVVSDPESDGLGTPVTVTISVPSDHGTLHIGSHSLPVTVVGNGSRSLTLTGQAKAIQDLLNGVGGVGGLFFESAENVNHDLNGGATGDVTLTLSFNDTGSAIGSDTGDDSQPNNPADITTAITITAVNDAPSVNPGDDTSTITIGGTGFVAVPGFKITDVDAKDGYAAGEADDVIEVTVRVLGDSNTPLSAAQYESLGISLSSTYTGSEVKVDTTYTGEHKALQVRGRLADINDYLAGLQVQFANAGVANVDHTYRIEVIVDDRLRDRDSGELVDGDARTAGTQPVANGGDRNQNPNNNGLGPDNGAIPTTEIDPYVVGYVTAGSAVGGLYNLRSDSRELFISTVNDPGNITGDDVRVDEGAITTTNGSTATVTIGPITLADPDDNGATDLTVTVSVPSGFTINGVGTGGGTVTPTGGTSVTITGTEAEINARLASIIIGLPDPDGNGATDPANADWHGSFDVTVVYNDQGNTGLRPGTLEGDTNTPNAGPGDYAYVDTDPDSTDNALQTTRIFTVTVNPVNDAPEVTDPTNVTLSAVSEDTDPADINGRTVGDLFADRFSDPRDAGTANGADSFYGVAIVGATPSAGQGEWQYSTDGGGTWTAVGSRGASNALVLDKDAKLRFVPAADFHGTPEKLTVHLVETDDNDDSGTTQPTNGQTVNLSGTCLSGVGGATVYSAQPIDLVTSVTNVNDRPTGSDASITVDEAATNPAGQTVADLFGAGFSDATDDQADIAGGGDAATAFGGIAIVGNPADADTEGVWEYNTGGGWVAVGTVSDTSALVLPPEALLRFRPTGDANGDGNGDFNGTPPALSVRLANSAQTFGTKVDLGLSADEAQNTTSTWSVVRELGATVNPVNDAPGFSHKPSNPTVEENAGVGTGTPAVNLLDSGSVTDIDLGTTPGLTDGVFGAGSITAQLTDGIDGDVLQLGNGLEAGANGIATVTGGTGSTALVITFTPDATVEQVEAVLAAIQYTHTGDDPTNLRSGSADTQRSYTITLSDGNNVDAHGDHAGGPAPLTATKSGTITITATNDPPVATDNNETISEGAATVGGNVITDNDGHGVDSDPDTPVSDLSITNITPPPGGSGGGSVSGPTTVEGRYGTLTIQPDGSYTYTLNNDHPAVKGLNDPTDTLTEVFGYTLSDGSLTDTANLTITITGVDDPVTVTVPNDTSATSPDGDITDHVVFESALPDGSDPDTTPGANTTVSSSFTVVAEDGLDPDDAIVVGYTRADGSPATLTLTKAQVEALATTQQTITTRYGELVLNGYSVGTDGTVTIGYTYTLTTAPAVGGADTMDSFSITANDRDDDSDSQTLNIKIVDDAPAAVSDTNSLLRHEGTVGGNVYDNDQDTIGADGPAASGPVTGVRAGNDTGTPATGDVGGLGVTGKYGNVVIYADGSYTYTIDPANAEVIALGTGELTDEFVYTITDADGDTATATLTITIAANQPPEVEPESVTTPEDKPITGNLLTNDSDPDGDPLTVTEFVVDIGGTPATFTVPPGESTAAVIPGVGTITIGSDGSYEYVPEPDWHGTVPQVTYTVSDGTGDPVNGTRQSTLDITVTPVVDIETDTSSTLVNTPVTIPVLDNDSFEGDSPEVTGTTPPANGSVTVNPDGTITYTPNPGFTGTDTFTYTVTSGGVTETATVTVEVYNDPPAPQPDRVVTREDTPARGNVLANDGEPDGHPLTVTEFTVNGRTYTAGSTVNIPGAGSFTLRPDGSYTFVPVPDWHGNVPTITYTVSDGTGAVNHSASSELRITVTPVPDIEPDKTSTEEGKPVTIPVLDNDNFEGKPKITGTTPPANGTVTINPDGTITYTPNPSFTGTDTFTYTVTSGGVKETATVSVEVLPGKAQGLVGLPPDRLDGASGPSAFPHGPASGRHTPDAWISGLPRAGLGVEPVTYVHEAVVAAQTEREFAGDSQATGRIDMARPYSSGVQVPGMDLGIDPALFVQDAVRSSQSLAEFMQQLVQGRHGRVSLSVDQDLPTPGLYQPDAAKLVPQPDDSTKETVKPVPDAATPEKTAFPTSADADLLAEETAADDSVGHEAVRSAPSFADQLRRGATRLPMSVARI